MKKVLFLLLLSLALVSFAACGETAAEQPDADAAANIAVHSAEDGGAAADTPTQAEAPSIPDQPEEQSAPEPGAEQEAEQGRAADPAPVQSDGLSDSPAALAPPPYSQPTADTVLTVSGSALERDWYFSLADLQSLGGAYSGSYFSRGKEPQEATTAFSGIQVSYLLDSVIGAGYSRAVFTASDGYAGGYGPGAVNAWYINEKDPSAALPMILAWSEDGSPCELRLVMGQQIEGEYNRTFWVRDVVSIDLQ